MGAEAIDSGKAVSVLESMVTHSNLKSPETGD